MPVYTDQLKREVTIAARPQRIVSLVPSQTELLYDLGLDAEVIGITKFCVHPESWFRSKQRIGGTKTVKIDAVAALRPDLVIANKEENVKEQVDAIEKIAPVWVSDVNTIEEALEMIGSIGRIVGKEERGWEMAEQIRSHLRQPVARHTAKPPRTAYLVWKDPYMAAGGDTFIGDVLRTCGYENILDDISRYPSITPGELIEKKVELVLLSSEPYPFQQKHIDELQSQLPAVKIMLVDGETFSWYGSRMLKLQSIAYGL